MRDMFGRVSLISGVSAIAAAILLGLIVFIVMIGAPDRAVLNEDAQPKEERQSSGRTPEDVQPKEVQPKEADLSAALESLGKIRAEESTAFQAYNNALYEQKQLDEEIGQLEVDLVVDEQQLAETQPNELEAKQQQLIETTDEVIARQERFESVEAEKQAYLDSLSSELRAQIQAEQERRIEEARAAAAGAHEQFTSKASDPATTPPQPIQGFEAEVPRVEKVEAEVGETPGTQESPQLAADLQYSEEVVPDQQQETLPEQQQEATLVEETGESDSPPSDPPPPDPGVANAVVAEATSFIGTQAVDDTPAAPKTLTVQPEPAPAGAGADQYQPQEEPTMSTSQEQDATTEGLQPSPETGTQPAGENSTASPVTPSGQAVVDEGAKYTGTRYKLGGIPECVPYETMDCSCLTMTVYAQFGVSLPDSPEAQMGYGTPVSGEPQAGDLVFWSEDGSGVITHVGIATGKGTTVHASGYAGYVTETPIEYIPGYVGARRLL